MGCRDANKVRSFINNLDIIDFFDVLSTVI